MLLEVLRCHGFDRQKLVDAGIVDENIQATEGALSFGEDAGYFLRFCYIALNGDGFATLLVDPLNYGIGAGLAACVGDDNGCAFFGKMLRNGSANSLGGSGDDRDLPVQFAHNTPSTANVSLLWMERPIRTIRKNAATAIAGIGERFREAAPGPA